MSLVSSRLSLIHRCRIERIHSPGVTDGWENTPEWETHLSGLACRAWQPSGREVVVEHDTVVSDDEIRMILQLGTDVTERDRVAGICYRDDMIYTGPLQIRAIITRKDHLSLILVKAA